MQILTSLACQTVRNLVLRREVRLHGTSLFEIPVNTLHQNVGELLSDLAASDIYQLASRVEHVNFSGDGTHLIATYYYYYLFCT